MAALVVAVVLVVGIAVLLVNRPTAGAAGRAVPPDSAGSTQSIATSTPTPAQLLPGTVAVTTIGATTTVTRTASVTKSAQPAPEPSVVRPAPTRPAPVDPMGGPPAAISCDTGYVVQVASELSRPAFIARVQQIRSEKQLPAASKWAQTSSSCPIFHTTVNAFVLFVGPFFAPYAACAARLASPPDAFVRTTSPANSSQYISCLCPATVAALPTFSTIGMTGVWVGELQRVLTSRLQYSISDLEPDPVNGIPNGWGVYTSGTASAVARFQSDSGLAGTGQLDTATWAAVQTAEC